MTLGYKSELGGAAIPRAEWARRQKLLRSHSVSLLSPESDADSDAANLIAQGASDAHPDTAVTTTTASSKQAKQEKKAEKREKAKAGREARGIDPGTRVDAVEE